MNCPNCREDVEKPCKSSEDCAGCYRLADKPEPVKRDKQTADMLDLLTIKLCEAGLIASDIGIWTANRATLTEAHKKEIADMRNKLWSMRVAVQLITGAGND